MIEYEVLKDDKLNISIEDKMKILRHFPDGEFKVVQLDDNPMLSVPIGTNRPTSLQFLLVRCRVLT